MCSDLSSWRTRERRRHGSGSSWAPCPLPASSVPLSPANAWPLTPTLNHSYFKLSVKMVFLASTWFRSRHVTGFLPKRHLGKSAGGVIGKTWTTLDTQVFSSFARHALSNMITTWHRWLFKIKLIKVKLKIQFLSHTSYMSSTRCSPGVVAAVWDSADRVFPSLQKVLLDNSSIG